ncbi:glutathione S-transferase family protein [Hydrogenophaga sp.]|uniref:glutathione S-transferase family protein n=1 Tax=Hydrogenophaga sp. TaxID=1904254 RepID=UPI003F6BD32C
MTLKIYGNAASRAIRPLWAAEELGIAYEHIPLHYQDEARKAPAFLALNPNGTVPAIDDGGLVLFESLAITLHLARTRPQGGLWASGDAGPSQILQWTLWAATEIEPLARQWFHHTSFLPPEKRHPELAKTARAQLQIRLQVLDDRVKDQDYLLSKGFTVADLNLAAVLQRLAVLGGEHFAHATAWHQRCMARPAAQRAMAMRQVQ